MSGRPESPTSEDPTVWTMGVPEAGAKYFKLGRNASYAAAKAGVIPTVRVGRKLKALVRVLEANLIRGS